MGSICVIGVVLGLGFGSAGIRCFRRAFLVRVIRRGTCVCSLLPNVGMCFGGQRRVRNSHFLHNFYSVWALSRNGGPLAL